MRNRDGKNFDLMGLRCFARVAEQASISSAATTLGMAQSAMSRYIAQLEAVVGHRLFHRNGRGVELTELGQKILPRARAFLADADQLISDANALQHRPTGNVTVGVMPSMMRPLVSRLYARLREDFPDIRLTVLEAYSGQVEIWLAEGRVDLGIYSHYRPLRRTSQDALFTAEMQLVGKKGTAPLRPSSVRFSSIARLPLVMPTRPNNLRALLDEIASRQRLRLDVLLETDSPNIIKDAVRNNGLYCVLPRHAISDELRQDAFDVCTITHPVIRQNTYVDTTPRRQASEASRVVRKLMLDLTRDMRQ